MTKLQKKFGAKVKELRKKPGYTQEQLAELLNIGIRSLGKIETGNSFPSTENLEKIMEIFNIMPSEMFNFEHLQPKEDLKKLTLEIIDSNPDKIKEIYKLVKAITE